MPHYRFYPSIKEGGRIAGPLIDHDAPNDKAAVDNAKQLMDGYDLEIWQAERIIAYLTPDQK